MVSFAQLVGNGDYGLRLRRPQDVAYFPIGYVAAATSARAAAAAAAARDAEPPQPQRPSALLVAQQQPPQQRQPPPLLQPPHQQQPQQPHAGSKRRLSQEDEPPPRQLTDFRNALSGRPDPAPTYAAPTVSAAPAAAVQAAIAAAASAAAAAVVSTRKMGGGLQRPSGFKLPRKVGEVEAAAGASSSSLSSSSAAAAAAAGAAAAASTVPAGPNGQPSILQRYGPSAAAPLARPLPDHMQGVDLAIAEELCRTLVYSGDDISFDDIAGLDSVKRLLYEAVVYPMQAGHLLAGSKLLEMPKGILLFGPPGTGKTLLAKAAASQLKATFLCVSASSLGSKWHGESERMVKALFAAATEFQPTIIFIDEIDSLLTARKDNEDAATGKIKTQMLIEMDGANRRAGAKVLVMGATNRPDLLDEAVRRRFSRRILIPLPDAPSRLALINRCLKSHGGPVDVPGAAREELSRATEGFSSADVEGICRAASQRAFNRWLRRRVAGEGAGAGVGAGGSDGEGAAQNRGAELHVLQSAVSISETEPIRVKDLKMARKELRPSVSADDVRRHVKFDDEFGFRAAAIDDDDDEEDDEREGATTWGPNDGAR